MRLLKTLAVTGLALLALGHGAAHAATPLTGLTPGPDFAQVPGFTPGPFAADGRGRVFVLAQDATSVVVHSVHGTVLAQWPTQIPARPTGDGRIGSASARIAVSPAGDVYVLTRDERRLRRYTASGEFVEDIGEAGDEGDAFLESPLEIAVTPGGELVVGQSYGYGGGQLVLDAGGRLLQRRSADLSADMAAGPDGVVWSAHPFKLLGRDGAGRVTSAKFYPAAGGTSAGDVVQAGSLAVTPANELLSLGDGVFSPGSKRLQVFGPDGRPQALCAVSSQDARPELAVGSDGTLFVGDGPRIRSYRPSRRTTACEPAGIRITSFKVLRVSEGSARISVRVEASRRLVRRGFRLELAAGREDRTACQTGEPDPGGACTAGESFMLYPGYAGNIPEGRRTVRKTARVNVPPEGGRYRFHLSVRARATGEVATLRGVAYTAGLRL